MYIERVRISNIKGFAELDLNFSGNDGVKPGWCVITGDNGAGKTALLKSISLAILGPDQSRSLMPDLSGWITAGESLGTVSVEILPDHELDKTEKGGYPTRGTFWAEVMFNGSDGPTTLEPADVYKQKKKGATNGPWASKTAGWLTLGYGPFRRMYGSSPDAQRLMVIPGRIPHFATLFKEDATLSEGEEWIKNLNYKKLEQKAEEGTILESLLNLIGDDFLRQGIRIKDVTSDGINLLDAIGRQFSLAEMSEGYRSALAMLIDIFRHMVDSYGISGLIEQRDDVYVVDRPAVVLIDEIDAHLHPAWQRDIGPWLKARFPKVQFVVTTHSPIVCQAADHGRIYHIPSPGDGSAFQLSTEDFDKVVAGKPDEILITPAFGLKNTRSERAVRARERFSMLRAKQITLGKLSPDETQEIEQLALFTRASVNGEVHA